MADQEQVSALGSWLTTPSNTNWQEESANYQYKPSTLPGKPKVLDTGNNLSAPMQTGVNFGIEQS